MYMSEWKEFSAKTVDEALTNALIQLEVTSDRVEYEVIEKESSGILGLFSRPALIRVRIKYSLEDIASDFLSKVFKAMEMEVKIDISTDSEENVMNIDLSGSDMGPLIGKRGSTLDSLQYLTSLVVNRESEGYMRIKLDTENYRARRKETLENLAKNIAHKVKRIHRSVYLEPMNPYERRIIHSALQNDKYVETHSEGEEPYRKVVVTLKPGVDTGYERSSRYSYGGGRSSYNRSGGYHKKKYRDSYPYQDDDPDKEQKEKKEVSDVWQSSSDA